MDFMKMESIVWCLTRPTDYFFTCFSGSGCVGNVGTNTDCRIAVRWVED